MQVHYNLNYNLSSSEASRMKESTVFYRWVTLGLCRGKWALCQMP